METKVLSLILGLVLVASFGTLYLSQHQKTSSPLAFDQRIINDPEIYSHVDPDELHFRVTLFKDWTLQHEKQYGSAELPRRFHTWNKNYEFVQDHNSKNLSWTVEMNKFADLSSEEFGALYTGYNAAAYDAEEEAENVVILEENYQAENLDWRNKSAVTAIRDQGQCGSCYAFASAAALEGLYAISQNKTPNWYSPQQVVDCSTAQGNQGCNGGLMSYVFTYTKAYGIENDTDYTYKAVQSSCKYNKTKAAFYNTGYTNVQANYMQLKAAAAKQPVAVAIEADQNVFQLYKSGVISSGCGTNLDHGVSVVGYAYDNSTSSSASNYWIVKNHWGTSWGEQGYIRIALGSSNVCGINSQPVYPTK